MKRYNVYTCDDDEIPDRKRIIVPIGCRSDEGLSAPVIKRLKEHFEIHTIQLKAQDFGESYSIMDKWMRYWGEPDLILIVGDRVEMCAAAAAAFHNKVKIAHFYGGVVNDPKTTFDDTDRDVISLWANIHFVEDIYASYRVADVKNIYVPSMPFHPETCLNPSGIFVVGISHLDDLEVDESKVPKQPYDLILLNYEPLGEHQTIPTIDSSILQEGCDERNRIQIVGNPDGDVPIYGVIVNNLPRPQFLGFLKNCERFITNSSAAIYEAPHFLKPEQIIMVGDRNKNRPRGPFQIGASDRIVEILKEYLK